MLTRRSSNGCLPVVESSNTTATTSGRIRHNLISLRRSRPWYLFRFRHVYEVSHWRLAHSPSLPHLSGTDCRYTFVPSSQLTVLKSHWSLSSSPLTAPSWYVSRHCDLCDRSSAIALMRALVMNSVVLRRVRNRLRIIIIIINTKALKLRFTRDYISHFSHWVSKNCFWELLRHDFTHTEREIKRFF